jgi:ABC-type transport system involved in multi-copper enzyme maturation permease subunit
MGNNALRDIDAGLGNPNDRGLVVAGRILGIIVTVLLVLGILICGAIFLLVILGGTATRWGP